MSSCRTDWRVVRKFLPTVQVVQLILNSNFQAEKTTSDFGMGATCFRVILFSCDSGMKGTGVDNSCSDCKKEPRNLDCDRQWDQPLNSMAWFIVASLH